MKKDAQEKVHDLECNLRQIPRFSSQEVMAILMFIRRLPTNKHIANNLHEYPGNSSNILKIH